MYCLQPRRVFFKDLDAIPLKWNQGRDRASVSQSQGEQTPNINGSQLTDTDGLIIPLNAPEYSPCSTLQCLNGLLPYASKDLSSGYTGVLPLLRQSRIKFVSLTLTSVQLFSLRQWLLLHVAFKGHCSFLNGWAPRQLNLSCFP